MASHPLDSRFCQPPSQTRGQALHPNLYLLNLCAYFWVLGPRFTWPHLVCAVLVIKAKALCIRHVLYYNQATSLAVDNSFIAAIPKAQATEENRQFWLWVVKGSGQAWSTLVVSLPPTWQERTSSCKLFSDLYLHVCTMSTLHIKLIKIQTFCGL